MLPEPLFVALFYSNTAGRLGELPSDGLVNVLWAVAAVENARRANTEAGEAADQQQQQQKREEQQREERREEGPGGAPGPGLLPERAGAAAGDGGEPPDAEALRRMVRERISAAASAAAAAAAAAPGAAAAPAGEGGAAAAAQGQGAAAAPAGVEAAGAAAGAAAGGAQPEELQRLQRQLREAEGRYQGTFRPVPLWQEDLLEELGGQMGACPGDFDKVSVVKLLWALAQLQLVPPQPMARALLAIAGAQLRAGAFQPLELVYLTRSCSQLLDCQQAGGGALPGEFAAFLAAAADALAGVRRLPPEWARINVRYPPYAIARGEQAGGGGGA